MKISRRGALLGGAAIIGAPRPSQAQLVLHGSGRSGSSTPPWPAETDTIGPASPAAGSAVPGGDTWIFGGVPVARSGTLSQVQIFAGTSAAVKIKRLTRSGATFTWVSEQTVNVVSGLNTFTVSGSTLAAQPFNAGDYIAIYSTTANYCQYTTPTVSGTEYFDIAATDVLTTATVTSSALPTQGLQFQCNFSIATTAMMGLPAVGPVIYVGPITPAPGSTPNSSTGVSYYDDQPIITPCRMETIEANATTAGYCLILILQQTSTGYSLYRAFRLNLLSGHAIYTAGTDFPIDVYIPANSMLGFWAAMTALSADATAPRSYRQLDSASPSMYPTTNITVFSPTVNASTINHQIKFGVRRIQADTPNTIRTDVLFSSQYSLDYDSTGWSVTGNTAVNSATGLGNLLVYRLSGYYDAVLTLTAQFTTGSDEIAILRQPMTPGDNLGAVWTVNQNTGLIGAHGLWDGTSTLPAAGQTWTTTLTHPMASNHPYQFTLTKIGRRQNFSIKDMLTGTVDSQAFWDSAGSGGTPNFAGGTGIGKPGFAATAGTLHVAEMKFTTLAAPTAMFFGDSITEGTGATVDANGWAYKAIAGLATANNGLISPHSGTASTNILARIEYEIRRFYPRFVVVLIGTNDTVEATWQTNMQYIINRINECGATPIICCLPPQNTPKNWIETTANPWIVANVPAGQVARFDLALTSPSDGTFAHLNGALMFDALHPNNAGHLACYNRLVSDCPLLFT